MTGQPQGRFTGKVAFVTGAAGGIGRAAALAFAREGAAVVVVDLLEGDLQETAQLIQEAGGKALAVTCNVARAADVQAALDQTMSTFGRMDAAFNNAGVEQLPKALIEISEEEWERIIGIDLRGVFFCMKYQIPLMLAQGGGAIVNTSSGAGIKGFKDQAAYVAAKHGVIGLSKSAALDYASQHIRINAVCPGIIDTPMMDRFAGGTLEGKARELASAGKVTPIGRAGNVKEIAEAVLWLCSDDSSFVTGSALVIDGGQTV